MLTLAILSTAYNTLILDCINSSVCKFKSSACTLSLLKSSSLWAAAMWSPDLLVSTPHTWQITILWSIINNLSRKRTLITAIQSNDSLLSQFVTCGLNEGIRYALSQGRGGGNSSSTAPDGRDVDNHQHLRSVQVAGMQSKHHSNAMVPTSK